MLIEVSARVRMRPGAYGDSVWCLSRVE